MSTETYSIFNDILGPVLTGPSSSHTAAPAKIGYMAKHLLSCDPAKLKFAFNKGGSFAASYFTQGTDRGLVGGFLGYKPDDERLLTALEDAEKKGIEVVFTNDEYEASHPNTVLITATGQNEEIAKLKGISLGGGILKVIEIDDFEVSITGKYYELLIYVDSICTNEQAKDIIEKITTKYDYINICVRNNKTLIDAKLGFVPDEHLLNRIKEMQSEYKIKLLPAVFPVLSQKESNVPFKIATELVAWAEENNLSVGKAGCIYEMQRGNLSEEDAIRKMEDLIGIMEDSINKGLNSNRPGKLIKACSGNYLKAKKEKKLVDCGAMDTAIAWTMAMVERNSYYGTVVAAPTSGACGTVPGTILGVADFLGSTKEEKVLAMFAAGAIGLIIAEEGTFAAEICGCQAECGSASAMAAAGIVQLLGGNVKQACEAASIALQNVLGMICDSVANLVEVPCLGRNVMGSVNAISAANMVIAGEEAIIPFDEVVKSMIEVGKLMPRELCCTNSGGLAVTETSIRLAAQLK